MSWITTLLWPFALALAYTMHRRPEWIRRGAPKLRLECFTFSLTLGSRVMSHGGGTLNSTLCVGSEGSVKLCVSQHSARSSRDRPFDMLLVLAALFSFVSSTLGAVQVTNAL